MKKIVLMLGAFLMFGVASAQTDSTRTPAKKAKTEHKSRPVSGISKKDTLINPDKKTRNNNTQQDLDKSKNPNKGKKTTPPPTEGGTPDPIKPQ